LAYARLKDPSGAAPIELVRLAQSRNLTARALTETAARLGIRVIVLFLAAFALYLPFQRLRRHRMIRVFRQARVDPSDLDGSAGWP